MVRSHAPVRQNTALRLPPELDQLGVVFVDAAQSIHSSARGSRQSRTGLPYGPHNPLLVGACDQGDARTRRRERADGEGRRRGPHSTSAPHAIASSSARSPPPTMSIGNATSLACVEWRITAAAAAAATTIILVNMVPRPSTPLRATAACGAHHKQVGELNQALQHSTPHLQHYVATQNHLLQYNPVQLVATQCTACLPV